MSFVSFIGRGWSARTGWGVFLIALLGSLPHAYGQCYTFATEEDFNEGFLINVEGVDSTEDELRIRTQPQVLPYI